MTYDYDPFGNVITKTGSLSNSYLYAGYQFDDETGLYYLNARYYDPVVARFESADTYTGQSNDPLSLNLYTYCENEPMMYSDPTGHWQEGDYSLSAGQQAAIAAATIAYNNATTQAGRDAAHAAADAARNGTTTTWNSTTGTSVNINGSSVGNTAIVNGSTTGNLTDITAGLGGTTTWNGSTNTATTVIDGKTVTYDLNSVVNGVGTASDGTPFTIANNKIIVGVRSVSESSGAQIDWNSTTQTVSISKDTAEVVPENYDTPVTIVPVSVVPESVVPESVVPLSKYIDSRALVKQLINDPQFVYYTQHPDTIITFNGKKYKVRDLFYAFGFEMDANDIWHARQDCGQRYWGYNDLYDKVFSAATDMYRAKFEYTTDDGQDYIIWAWKGDYLNLGAGAELGIYKRLKVLGIGTPQWLADTDDAMKMTLNLWDAFNSKIVSYSPSKKQWWVTGFNPYKQDRQAVNLAAEFTIDFSNHTNLYDAFLKSPDYLKNTSRWTKSTENKYLLRFSF